ncbi:MULTISPECIES: lycopene cyclase family protein [unclassified Pseudonocardia]|uniref:lycopene cyclase family protein n=1 Tax=unclassified Pseudonocardia TaxID=2619320 RepID=UPI00094AEE46|nr:lycopene cyclase family protein [Pseudonocardia sp. Ae707_Ps1]OLM19033.1 Lycopene beta cyclase [Pseudonocardia sp. Ae707_Ps1]
MTSPGDRPPSGCEVDVLVLGGGPAGRALAGACAARGLRTALADPAPDRPWTATYCAWPEELPPGLPESAVAARPPARVVVPGDGGTRDLGPYLVLDTGGLRAHLDAGLTGVTVLSGRADDGDVRPGPDGYRVRLRGTGAGTGTGQVTSALVADATGAPSRLRPAAGTRAEQTAYGVVVPEAAAAPVVAPGEAVFMDWRSPATEPPAGWTDWPTFLYAVPYGDGSVLLEETSLARRPGLPLPELRDRLAARLDALGVVVPGDAPVERVRFPVDTPRGPRHPLPFGAATPLVHPATGFSVAPALRLAPALADVLARHLPDDPARATTAAHRLLWSRSARLVHRLRRHGLRTVLDLPAGLVPSFFDAFFTGPRGRAFLTGRDDLPGTLAGMAGVFGAATAPVRWHMLRSAAPFHPKGR